MWHQQAQAVLRLAWTTWYLHYIHTRYIISTFALLICCFVQLLRVTNEIKQCKVTAGKHKNEYILLHLLQALAFNNIHNFCKLSRIICAIAMLFIFFISFGMSILLYSSSFQLSVLNKYVCYLNTL